MLSSESYQRCLIFQSNIKRIMFDIGQGISYAILSIVIVITYILYFIILWYIKTKAPGTITPFDKVTIDTILIRLFQLTLIYIGIFIYIIEECPTWDIKNIVLSLANYILALLVMSSEILNEDCHRAHKHKHSLPVFKLCVYSLLRHQHYTPWLC